MSRKTLMDVLGIVGILLRAWRNVVVVKHRGDWEGLARRLGLSDDMLRLGRELAREKHREGWRSFAGRAILLRDGEIVLLMRKSMARSWCPLALGLRTVIVNKLAEG
jgi:hypothetical protein